MSYQSHFKKAKAARKTLTEAEVEAQLRKAFGLKSSPSGKTPLSPKRVNKRKKGKKSGSLASLYPVLSLMALFVGLSSYMIFPNLFNDLFDHIQIEAMAQANASSTAEDAGKKDPSPKGKSEEKAAPSKDPGSGEMESKREASVQEDASYLSKLKERQAALDLREAELNQLEEELQRQKVEIEQRIEELSGIREEIATKLEDRVQADEEKVKKLVDLYSSMKPKQAAKIIEKVNRELAVEVLAKMKKKSAADIMNVMDGKVAKELSERIAGYRRIPASTK